MRERPILFSGPMIRAILAGTKTQTRRVIRPQPDVPADAKWIDRGGLWWPCIDTLGRGALDPVGPGIRCPLGEPGDRLWVRETWGIQASLSDPGAPPDHFVAGIQWAADLGAAVKHVHMDQWRTRYERVDPWRPSIHMPRWASRIDLEVVSRRAERVQDISEADARAEGVERVTSVGPMRAMGWRDYAGGAGFLHATDSFRSLWESIHGAGAWAPDDWVWVVEFRRVRP